MPDRIHLLAIIGSLGVLGLVIDLLRRRRLKEEYSLLWLGVAIAFFIVSWGNLLERLAAVLGVAYAPAALFLLMIVGAYLLLMHFSLVISRMAAKHIELAQEVGLLQHEIDRLRAETKETASRQGSHFT